MCKCEFKNCNNLAVKTRSVLFYGERHYVCDRCYVLLSMSCGQYKDGEMFFKPVARRLEVKKIKRALTLQI